MSPIKISDPTAPRRKQETTAGRWMSAPMAVMMICCVAALPPIARLLVALDSTLHAHNDTIVTAILWIAPFALVALAIAGLVAMYRGRPHSTI